MIAYTDEMLDNRAITQWAGSAAAKKLISPEEHKAIETAHPDLLYSPNIFIRTGLFLLTVIVTLMGFGLLFLFSSSSNEKGLGGLAIFCGLLCYAGLELIIREKRHKGAGTDDALLLMGPAMIVSGAMIINPDISFLNAAILVFALALIAAIRYANVLMSIITFLSFFAFTLDLLFSAGVFVKAILPFLTMGLSAVIYIISKRSAKKQILRHYGQCLTIIEVLALLTFYCAGNYFVVRETSNELLALNLKEGESIPLGWLFWIFTALIPLIYIFRGIQKKDSVLLRSGLVLIAAIVFTIRFYHSVMPLETAMATGGAMMILIAYILTRYLSVPKHGFTNKETDNEEWLAGLHLESLVIAQTFQQSPAGSDNKFDFGGGTGGGAGAGGEF